MNGNISNKNTNEDALIVCTKILEEKFGNDAKIKAFELLSYANDVSISEFKINHLKKNIDSKTFQRYIDYANRFSKDEPLQYIIGKAFFYEDEFVVSPAVLIPRFDTENLVSEAIKISREIIFDPKKERKINYLEFCTGSGCIPISYSKKLREFGIKSKGYATDISKQALEIAKLNKERISPDLDIAFLQNDLLNEKLDIKEQSLDIILSNPPYIRSSIISTLDSQVKDYEPQIALDGGEDGLCFYVKIIQHAKSLLRSNGYLLMEIGFDQAQDLIHLLTNSKSFDKISIRNDLSYNPRVIIARRI